jgi:hypothetical protein
MNAPPDLKPALARIEALVEEIEKQPDLAARERSRQLVQALLDVHRMALERLLQLAAAAPGGAEVVAGLERDGTVALLLSLHGLHREDLDTRVRAAMDALGPLLSNEGVAVALDSVADDRVRLRVTKADGQTPRVGPSRLRGLIEAHLGSAVPELAAVEIEGLDGEGVVQIGLGPRRQD